MQLKHLHRYFIILICLSFARSTPADPKSNLKLLTSEKNYVAGDHIVLKFEGVADSAVEMYCSNSFGSIVIFPETKSNTINFHLPESFSNKSGMINWKLIQNTTAITGNLFISPQPDVHAIENYIGPPSIIAGGEDTSMLVSIPTDALDNVLKDNTLIQFKYQFLNEVSTKGVKLMHGIAFDSIKSSTKEGRLILSTSCLSHNSKEYDLNIISGVPVDFKVNFKRNHSYADGNQITTFYTSVLKDIYGNIVSDGTYVKFVLTDSNGLKSNTTGITINGIATAGFLHPDHQKTYQLKAFVEGMAESDAQKLTYKTAIHNFEVLFSDDKRKITIGPLLSFMNQRVPDGLSIKMKVFQKDTLLQQNIKETKAGITYFRLNKDRFTKGIYRLEFSTAGIQKTFDVELYE